MTKKIDEFVLRWFSHLERMENDRIAKRVYIGECAGSQSVGRPWKRWIDIVKDCLRERGLDVGQTWRMVGVCEGECMGLSPRNEPLTLTRCHSCGWPQLYEAHGWRSL